MSSSLNEQNVCDHSSHKSSSCPSVATVPSRLTSVSEYLQDEINKEVSRRKRLNLPWADEEYDIFLRRKFLDYEELILKLHE